MMISFLTIMDIDHLTLLLLVTPVTATGGLNTAHCRLARRAALLPTSPVLAGVFVF